MIYHHHYDTYIYDDMCMVKIIISISSMYIYDLMIYHHHYDAYMYDDMCMAKIIISISSINVYMIRSSLK